MYAKSGVGNIRDKSFVLIDNMGTDEKECMLYLPIYSELKDLKIGVDEKSTITPLQNPFKHKIVIFGSSFTHGVSTSRPGMSYPMQIERNTGLFICNIACSGNCKLQQYFANYIKDLKNVDAIVFDAFSNPSATMIADRLFPFIKIIQSKLPYTPLIFVQTIYRENRNFNRKIAKEEERKICTSDSLMKIAVKKFKNVFYINPDNLTGNDHVTSADGTIL